MDENERKDINSEETENTSTEEVSEEGIDKFAEKESPSVSVSNKKPNLVPIISAIVAAVAVITVVLIVLLSGQNDNNGDTHTHNFGNWTITKNATCKDEGETSRSCECGETETRKIDKINTHTEVVDPAVESTCKTNGKTEGKHCSVCDKIIVAQTDTPLKEHTPTTVDGYDSTCKQTGITDSKKCSVCDVELEKGDVIPLKSHEYTDKYDESCNECGFVRDAECAHLNTSVIPGKAATCTKGGITEGTKCNKCGEILVVQTTISKLGHTEVIDAAVAATCTTDGKTEGKHCSVCNETIIAQNTIPASHTDGEWITDANATCTKDGSKHQVCAVCSASIKTEAIAATGHTDGEWITDTNATCTVDGSKHQVCSVCNATIKTEPIAATGHTDGEWVTDTNATCTEDGSKHQVCSVCNATIKTEVITALGHSYSMTIVNRDCGNNGKKVYTCGTCEHSYDEGISSIVLSFMHTSTSSATVNGYGSYSKGYAITITGGYGTILLKYELYTSATATNPTNTIDFTTDTATSVSFRGYANAIDNYIYKITVKDEAGNISIYRFSLKDESLISYEHKGEVEHTFSDWSVTKESTCSEYGEKQSTCSVCNNIITDIVEKKPHTTVVDEAVPSNCLQTGLTEGSHCSVCETVIVAQTETPSGEHSYENKICICGRDVTEDAIETYDLSKNQDGSILGYVTNSSGGQKVYILGNGATKNYSNSTTFGGVLSPFYINKSITEVYIGEGITSIGDCMFWFCSKLKTVNISQSVTYIGSYSFQSCSLTKITLPNRLTKIGNAAFDGNHAITDIVFPESLEYIGEGAFTNCNMTSIYIPKNVSYIGKEAFSFNIGLSQITVDENNSIYYSDNNCIIHTSTKTLAVGCKNSIIPSDGSVIDIGAYAFSGSKLTNLIIPSSIVKIGEFAFSACSMTEVVIPISVKTIGSSAFYLCKALTIYCEASSQPSDWNNNWDDTYYSATVVWGYTE